MFPESGSMTGRRWILFRIREETASNRLWGGREGEFGVSLGVPPPAVPLSLPPRVPGIGGNADQGLEGVLQINLCGERGGEGSGWVGRSTRGLRARWERREEAGRDPPSPLHVSILCSSSS